MLELRGFWPNDGGNSTSLASCHTVQREVHVLLVDHDFDSLISTAKMLELCLYKVTCVELASTALKMLSTDQKSNFNLVMANINSPDMHGYKLLQRAVSMDIPVILLSVDDNVFLATGALENGALLYIKKPVTLDIMKCLWQHVEREKMSIRKERERVMGRGMTTEANNKMGGGIEFRGEIEEENNIINVGSSNMNIEGKRKVLGRQGLIEDEEYRQIIDNKVRRRVCTEWTRELHEKFMDAVRQLGDGRCFPKEILKRMNVPGLTRMQVASHLQKCRNDNWRPPEERKYEQNNVPAASDPRAQNKLRRFGSMPCKKDNNLLFQEPPESSQGTKIQFAKDGGQENMTTAPILNSHQQYHESGPSNVRPGSNPSSNPRYPSDGFFNFLDMDYLIHNYSSMPQGSSMNMNQRTSPEAIHDHSDQVDHDDDQQNSAMPNADSGSHWSSETSIFASISSETGGQET